MQKLSQRQIHKISKRDLDVNELILKMKAAIKRDKAVVEKFKEYKVSLDDIDNVFVSFVPLDVSAKTKDRKIYLNENMLSKDNPFEFAIPYLIHEIVHYLQQSTRVNLCKNKADDYLDKDSEIESFQVQVDFKKRHEGENSAREYTKKLLDYHGLEGKERKEKAKELLEDKK